MLKSRGSRHWSIRVNPLRTETLAIEFPVERERVEALALEAALSRVYAGIHYRFDATVGLALGRSVAQKAAAADLREVAVLP